MPNDLLFHENKSTPKVVPHGEKFDAPEAYGKLVKRRPATEDEEQWMKDNPGKWLRVDVHGNKPGDPGYAQTKMPGREHLRHADAFINDILEQEE